MATASSTHGSSEGPATSGEEKSPGNTAVEAPEAVGELLTTLSDIDVGMKLEAKDAYGKWYIAKVVELDEEEEEALVHFERWNSRYDEFVKVSSGRLRVLLPERRKALERDRERTKKKLSVGDLIQAKWEDGRMYFGKVLKVYKEEVDVLFDDGVKYKAPLAAVRKRNHTSRSVLSRSSLQESDSSQALNPRTLRAQKRHRSDDSISQASYSSPPSSPVFLPSKRRRRRLDSDSTYSDSDLDDSLFQTRSLEDPLPDTGGRRNVRRRACKLSMSASSDSDASVTPAPLRKRKRSLEDTREPFQLRLPPQPLSPVKELSTLTPKQSESEQSPTGPSNELPPPPVVSADTPVTSKTDGKQAVSARKDPAVASRTRAQTKFENVSRRSDAKKPAKVAPKEMVIVWDHNEFKCKFIGCTKSFRKETLLQSHVKHYHSAHKPTSRQRATPGQSKEKSVKKESTVSPKGSSSLSPPPPDTPSSPGAAHQSPQKPSSGVSPKSAGKTDTELIQKAQSSAPLEGLEGGAPGSTSQVHLTAMLQSKLPPQYEPLLKSDKSPKKPHTQGSIFSVAGPPLKVPLVEIKALPRESLTPRTPATGADSSRPLGGEEAEVCLQPNVHSGTMTSEEDVVHCVCGDVTDEGFMIQCEQCLCWQHGDCVRMTKHTLPDKYVCCYCTNPPGLRSRLKYQFDRDWYSEGTLPSVSGGPRFPHGSSVRLSHQLTDTIYKLKKMLHSSKVKLQAASRVNHPYLRQWAKECTHLEKEDIISYLIAALTPISYCPQHKEAPQTNGASESGNGLVTAHNGSYRPQHSQDDATLSVASLQLDPLPQSVPPTPLSSSNGNPDESPDPTTLQLAPLPPLKTESLQQLTTEILKKSIQLSVSASARAKKTDGSSTSADTDSIRGDVSEGPKTEPHEVINDEFGVQELSVFALDSEPPPMPAPASPNKLISSSRSAFTPVVTPVLQTSALYPSTVALTAGPPQPIQAVTSLSSTPRLSSTMDSVSLGEFADAFMQGDTTNWYQRMRLLDHIEHVQEKASSRLESLEKQLEELPPDGSSENIEQLLQDVQSTMTQLRQVQLLASS